MSRPRRGSFRRHREELTKKLNEFRRVQREEEGEVCRELREVKSERSRLEQEVDLLRARTPHAVKTRPVRARAVAVPPVRRRRAVARIQLADVQREAEQAKLDLDQQKEKELAEMTERLEAAEGRQGAEDGQRAEAEKNK
eukprot:gene10303-18564_t